MSIHNVTNPDEIKAGLIDLTDHEVAFSALLRETGGDADLAARILSSPTGGLPDAAIARHRQELQDEADAALRAGWEKSPAGREHAAAKAMEAKEARALKVEAAKELLLQEGTVDAEELSEMSPEDILDAARIEPSPATKARMEDERLLGDPKAMIAHENERRLRVLIDGFFFRSAEDSREEAESLGISYDEIKAEAWRRKG